MSAGGGQALQARLAPWAQRMLASADTGGKALPALLPGCPRGPHSLLTPWQLQRPEEPGNGAGSDQELSPF